MSDSENAVKQGEELYEELTSDYFRDSIKVRIEGNNRNSSFKFQINYNDKKIKIKIEDDFEKFHF
jgi:hypothetical protein